MDDHTYLDEVQDPKFTLGGIHTKYEVEGSVVPVNQLAVGATNQTGRQWSRAENSNLSKHTGGPCTKNGNGLTKRKAEHSEQALST